MRALTVRKRSGMTLIEILVVIAIMAVLTSLLVVGVMAALRKGTDATTRSDIAELDVALKKFKADTNKVNYPPSTILLCANSDDYINPGLPGPYKAYAAASLQFLDTFWPNLRDVTTGKFKGIPWAGWDQNGVAIPLPATGIFLEGDQSLVFWLAGVPRVDTSVNPPRVLGMLGFSTDPANPAAAPNLAVKGADRKKYFEFDANRLYFRNNQTGNATCKLPSYNDAFSMSQSRFLDFYPAAAPKSARPIVYFSSIQLGNYKDAYDPRPIVGLDHVSPFVQSISATTKAVKYQNSNTFQLVAAGADGTFGIGSTQPPYPPANVMSNVAAWNQVVWTPGSYPGAGQDDLSNFWANFLNVP